MIRRIRELLYDQGFTISGARNRLDEIANEPARTARITAAASAAKPALAQLRQDLKTIIDQLRT
jgi:hypothetical protein